MNIIQCIVEAILLPRGCGFQFINNAIKNLGLHLVTIALMWWVHH